jgi:hypothetical protein
MQREEYLMQNDIKNRHIFGLSDTRILNVAPIFDVYEDAYAELHEELLTPFLKEND